MATQLGLDLPARAALGRDDFMVSPCNAVALAMVDGWRRWPAQKLVLSGASGAGKTHLTHVWATETNAKIISAKDLRGDQIEALVQSPVAVEDVPLIRTDHAAQTALFHLHNLLQDAGLPLLMTGTQAPAHWGMSLPDLQSRIDAAGHANLDAPDDALLAAVLVKLFNDRQLTPPADVIPYLLARIERSFDAARRVVAALDGASLARKKPVTRTLASTVLDNHSTPEG
ncbi:chromosomal replication initiator DnaA [Tateyamaria sp.]|uniref:chromosomal replication initiator DnaA n=1 Tax=Tateyamaria sp. TaxID=1929288 RepID=UPI00329D8639